MSNVIVSIVTWNSELYIEACIKSVLLSEYNNYQIVIFDNASFDKTLSIIESLKNSKITIIRNACNLGFASGHNYIINNFPGTYYLVLNPDARLAPGFIPNAIVSLDLNKEIGAIAGLILSDEDSHIIDSTGMTFLRSRRFILNNAGADVSALKLKCCYVDGVDGAVAFYKKEAIKSVKVNGHFFDPEYFAYGEDWDVAWRLKLAGYKCYFTTKAVGYHKRHFKQRNLFNRKCISKNIKYHSLKNSLLSILKNDDKQNICKDIFYILKRFSLVFGYSLLFEPYSLKAIWYVIIHWRKINEKRKLIQAKRKVNPLFFRKSWIKNSYES